MSLLLFCADFIVAPHVSAGGKCTPAEKYSHSSTLLTRERIFPRTCVRGDEGTVRNRCPPRDLNRFFTSNLAPNQFLPLHIPTARV